MLFGIWCGLVCHMTVVVLATDGNHHGETDDPHGGVPMGIPNQFCDDGENFTSIDWNPQSTDEYTCFRHMDLDVFESSSYETCEETAKRPIHVCFPEQLSYDEDLPTSGRHRPLWPKYGEYQYLPPQRWLHSLEASLNRNDWYHVHASHFHGAIVFLYNPCANKKQIRKLKALARGCLRRHIISPSKRIPLPNMFAVLAWQCKLVMTRLDVPKTVDFAKRHALHSPERSVYADGQYSIGLLHHAKVVTDKEDSEICPQMSLMAESTKRISERSRWRQKRLREIRNLLEQRGHNSRMSQYLNSAVKR